MTSHPSRRRGASPALRTRRSRARPSRAQSLVGGCGRGHDRRAPREHRASRRTVASRKAADLTTPENAVRSYLDFSSYAYRTREVRGRLADDGARGARLGSTAYIELDRQRGRKIDQQLDVDHVRRGRAQGADQQLVPAQEKWTYRYVDPSPARTRARPRRRASTRRIRSSAAPRAGWSSRSRRPPPTPVQ